MIYGAILEKGEEWYTELGRVFDAIHDRQKEYNWLITDVEYYSDKILDYSVDRGNCFWLTGEELTCMERTEDRQWIWAVLSGFDKRIPLEEILSSPRPYADGYPGFWKNPLTLQHPLASVEIVAFDSTLTLLLSREKSLVDDFRSAFPLSEDLFLYNQR